MTSPTQEPDDRRENAHAGRPDDATVDSPAQGAIESSQALYEQAMAHYQAREWRAALDYFKRLKRVQPNWPGLDSLIDEAGWFLQFDSEVFPATSDHPEDRVGQLPVEEMARSGRTLRRWLAPAVLIVIVLIALAVWQGWISGTGVGRSLERDALYNRGQSSLAVGDYEAARGAFEQLARLAPADPAAREGLERAARLEALTLDYQAAQAAVEAEDWATAESRLQAVLAVDPAYAAAADLLSFVRRQQEASALFTAGVAAYDQGDLAQAIERLERLSDLDAGYQRSAVRELLFVLYLSHGQELIATPDAGVDQIRQALGRFGKALALRPRNVQAAEESRLANQFLNARQALEMGDRRQTQSLLNAILAERPDYAGYQAAELLYKTLLRQAEEERAAGQLSAARRTYEQALALPVQDSSAAQAGLRALEALYTPTPPPTSAPTPPTLFVQVAAATLNVRLGPSIDFPAVGQVAAGDQLAALARSEAGDWLFVCCVGEQPGWVATRLVTSEADLALLPVAQPPIPPAQPTATATATETPVPVSITPPPPPPPVQPPAPRPPTPTPTPPPR